MPPIAMIKIAWTTGRDPCHIQESRASETTRDTANFSNGGIFDEIEKRCQQRKPEEQPRLRTSNKSLLSGRTGSVVNSILTHSAKNKLKISRWVVRFMVSISRTDCSEMATAPDETGGRFGYASERLSLYRSLCEPKTQEGGWSRETFRGSNSRYVPQRIAGLFLTYR